MPEDKLTCAVTVDDGFSFCPEDFDELFEMEILDFGSADSATSSSSNSIIEMKDKQVFFEQITNALNSHDYNCLFHYLRHISSPQLKIWKYVYSFDGAGKGLEEREFRSLEEFCQFMEVWNVFIPDGLFEISHNRKCTTSRRLSVLISAITFSGQQIVKDIDVLNDDLCLFYPDLSQVMINKLDRSKCPKIVILSGSFAVSINIHGFLEKLEFFFSKF